MDILQFLRDKGVSLSVIKRDSTTDVVHLGHRSQVVSSADLRDSVLVTLEHIMQDYKPLKIYLACPYSHEDILARKARFVEVTKKAGEMMKAGYLVYSPVTVCHPIVTKCDVSTGWDYWKELDKSFIEWCDEVWVVCLDGWKESKGIQAEIEIAKELGKEVKYL